MESRATTVTILGQEYTVRGGDDPEYVHAIARYVDDRMREVAQGSHQVSSAKIAILAALNIAEELFRERRRSGSGGVENLEERTHNLVLALEESFRAAAPDGAAPSGAPTQGATEEGGETLPGA